MIDHITPDNLRKFQALIDLSKTDFDKAETEIKELNRTSRSDLFSFVDYNFLNRLEDEMVCRKLKRAIFNTL
tara:strand:+ start:309 stop:524 length:216 start_codon:yes stop_codon:yes gene_type:complete